MHATVLHNAAPSIVTGLYLFIIRSILSHTILSSRIAEKQFAAVVLVE
jgi:hypothetical protein